MTSSTLGIQSRMSGRRPMDIQISLELPQWDVLRISSAWKVYRPRFKLKGLRRQITIKWIPGHIDILGNEMADYVAKQECSENALPGVTYTSICARIRHMVKDPPIQHEGTAEVYSAYSSSRECKLRIRRDQTLLAKLRTGFRTFPYWKVHRITRLKKLQRWI